MRQPSEARTTRVKWTRRAAPLWRRLPLVAAIAALGISCSFLPAATASAEPLLCEPEGAEVFFSQAGHNSATFEKIADGCAQPWLSYIAETAIIKLWVDIGGGYHNLTNTECVKGFGTCDLDPGWGSDCEGASCNNHKFHLQWANYKEGDDTYALLNY